MINHNPIICNLTKENKTLSLSYMCFDKHDKLITLSSYHIIISYRDDNDKGYPEVIIK